jgi:hypothetical protein
MAKGFLLLYLIALGGTVYAVGSLNALQNLLGLLNSLPGGWALCDSSENAPFTVCFATTTPSSH